MILKVKKIVVLICVFMSTVSFAQNLNRTDANGNRIGQWEKQYNNGKVRYRGQFENGKEVGFFHFYTETNQTKPYLVKEFIRGTTIANVQFFSSIGNLESSGQMDGKNRIGKWTYYGTKGEVVLEENYLNGKLSGLVTVYYHDGKITEESHYKDGVLHGQNKRYSSEGKLISDMMYSNGQLHGKIVYYDNKGVITQTGNYANGKRVGRWEFYIDGVLAGYDEPNKQQVRDTISLKELEARKKLRAKK